MRTLIFYIGSRYVRYLLVFFAVVALLRGHNHPGGGFIGGLLAGLSIVMKGFAYDTWQVREQLRIQPDSYIAIGLSMILLSVVPGILLEDVFMTGVWISIPMPIIGDLKLGTPLLFDIGVFFAVIGVTLMFLFSLKRAE